MNETIALFGAGGKMGVRLSGNLMKSDCRVRHVEPSPVGRQRLQIRDAQESLEFPGGQVIAPRMREFAGAFRAGVYSLNTRVDFTMHCVSAMVKIERGGLLGSSR